MTIVLFLEWYIYFLPCRLLQVTQLIMGSLKAFDCAATSLRKRYPSYIWPVFMWVSEQLDFLNRPQYDHAQCGKFSPSHSQTPRLKASWPRRTSQHSRNRLEIRLFQVIYQYSVPRRRRTKNFSPWLYLRIIFRSCCWSTVCKKSFV